ncbi:MAG: hypothetical protein IPK16_30225 [Anaerolineales bacterium]|nr:hypothetical protein [Anaerolineales bacterium]
MTAYFAPAFTTGLADTALAMAALVVAVAFVIFLGMKRGLKGVHDAAWPGTGDPGGGNTTDSEM